MSVTNLVLAGAGLLSVLCLLAWAENQRRHKQRRQRQAVGLSWLQSLRVLLSDIQRHRGLTTGYLNGSEALMHEIETLQQAAGRDIRVISSIDPWMESNERWQGITQHWARLAGRYQSNSPENNMNQHNALIQNLLYLIDDMAQEHGLLRLRSRDDKPLHIAWRELLSAAEYVGQTRAVGMGVAAAGHCDSVNRIRLKFLCRKVEENTERVWRDIDASVEDQQKVSDLMRCITEDVLRDRSVIKSQDFFHIASQALDSLHAQYDKIVEELKWHALG